MEYVFSAFKKNELPAFKVYWIKCNIVYKCVLSQLYYVLSQNFDKQLHKFINFYGIIHVRIQNSLLECSIIQTVIHKIFIIALLHKP